MNILGITMTDPDSRSFGVSGRSLRKGAGRTMPTVPRVSIAERMPSHHPPQHNLWKCTICCRFTVASHGPSGELAKFDPRRCQS